MSEQTTPCCDVVCRGKVTPGCAMQTTPRTVEEAAREEAERRWPMTEQEREMVSFGVRFAQRAARMPSVEEIRAAVGGVLWPVSNYPERVQARMLGQDIGPLRDKVTDAVVALWGGGERG